MAETTNGTNRKDVYERFIIAASVQLQENLRTARWLIEPIHCLRSYRLDQKGTGTLASKHEIYGVIAEEVHELLHAIESNKPLEEVQKELMDIAVACIFGAACINAGTVDW